jgi:hypothetical protein
LQTRPPAQKARIRADAKGNVFGKGPDRRHCSTSFLARSSFDNLREKKSSATPQARTGVILSIFLKNMSRRAAKKLKLCIISLIVDIMHVCVKAKISSPQESGRVPLAPKRPVTQMLTAARRRPDYKRRILGCSHVRHDFEPHRRAARMD